jgi:hypothetical protein
LTYCICTYMTLYIFYPWLKPCPSRMTDLFEYDVCLGKLERPNIPDSLRTKWTWELDLLEEISVNEVLNESHLTGLILCRVAGLDQPSINGHPCDILGDVAVIRIPYQSMSMQNLKDSVQHAQLHMHVLISTNESVSRFPEHLNKLFARLGHLMCPLPSVTESVFDDRDSLEVAPNGSTTKIVTCNWIRWILNTFVILFRHCELRRLAEPPQVAGSRLCIEEFHVEAALDDFYTFSQYFDLPPAAVLQYSHDYPQMLNSVSQVTFYHFPSYERRLQIPHEQVANGDAAIYTLAAALSMLPDVTVVFEHESFGAPPGAIGHPQHAKAGWRIILGSGFIYLLSPDGKVFRHENLLELVRAVPIPG